MISRLVPLTLSCLPLAMLFAADEAKPKRAMTPEDSYTVASAADVKNFIGSSLSPAGRNECLLTRG